jgi:hypothetical protein
MQQEVEAKVVPGWATGLESRTCDDPKMTRPFTPVALNTLADSASMRESQRAKTSGTHVRATWVTVVADRLQGCPGGGPETGPVHALVLDRGHRGQQGDFWWDLRLCIVIRTTPQVFRAATRCQYSARDSTTQS